MVSDIHGLSAEVVMAGAQGPEAPPALIDNETLANVPRIIVAGVSRFLAIESCGQFSPCKQDWSYSTPWSGEAPVGRFIDHRQRDDGRA